MGKTWSNGWFWKRIKLVAKDIVNHFEKRLSVIDGKGMIVTMSRRIAVEMYNEIVKIRPDWHDEDPHKGNIKVIITGSAADPLSFKNTYCLKIWLTT